jgi:hypothetical protein
LLAVVDPGAFGECGDRGLRDGRGVVEVKVLQAFDQREPRVEQPAAFAAFGDLGVQQRGQVGDRRLLLADGVGSELAESAA